MTSRPEDPFLATRLAKYEGWMAAGLIDVPSKVIPLEASLTARQWVVHTGQAMALLQEAKHIAVQPCECREHYQRCDRPREVCLVLDKVADMMVDRGVAQTVTLAEATDVLETARVHGLVHLGLYIPGRRIGALCSCCPCCCHNLQMLRSHGMKQLVAHADYRATQLPQACVACGACTHRCPFGALAMEAGSLHLDAEACLGCGLCVAACPEHALEMVAR